MPKPKRSAPKKARRPSESELDDFTGGVVDAMTEQLVVQQFRMHWDGLKPHVQAEFELLMASAGAIGHLLVNLSEAFDALMKGKAPSMTWANDRHRPLHRAACKFAEISTHKAKGKSKPKPPKRR